MLFASALAGECAAAGADPWDSAEAPKVAPPGAARLMGVRFGGDASSTRLVVDVSGPVDFKLDSASDSASRTVLSLPAVALGDISQGPGRGAIKDWRFQDGVDGVSLILSLSDGARLTHYFLLPPPADGRPYRLVIDVARGDAADVVRPSASAAPVASADPSSIDGTRSGRRLKLIDLSRAAEARTSASVTPHPTVAMARYDRVRTHPRLKVIVVDAGHGGHDPGAQSRDHNEKDVTLAAALTLRRRLEQSGRYRVVLTRGGDIFIPLEERVRIARKAGADLFISLHADSAGPDPGTHGASIYTLSDHGETRVHTVLGQHEWFNRAGKRSDPAVGQILLDLTQNNTRNRSSEFAGLLLQHLSDRVDLLPRTRRDAGYFVLLAPDVPAVLLEMGFISNPDDETRLTDPAQRRRLMDGVAEAIDSYFVGPTEVAAAPMAGTP